MDTEDRWDEERLLRYRAAFAAQEARFDAIPTDGCSIDDLQQAADASRDPELIQRTQLAPPKIQRQMVDRHRWMRGNLAITALVGVVIPTPTCPSRAPIRRSAPRSRRRRSSRVTRGPPDDDPDPEPEPPSTGAQHAGGAAS